MRRSRRCENSLIRNKKLGNGHSAAVLRFFLSVPKIPNSLHQNNLSMNRGSTGSRAEWPP